MVDLLGMSMRTAAVSPCHSQHIRKQQKEPDLKAKVLDHVGVPGTSPTRCEMRIRESKLIVPSNARAEFVKS